ncbi:MAG TPA: adenosine deaminase [Gemmatimonadaceae bacterium]|jgi:adenosine deaminase|nr:adenosine deaminase [Gemmatimonadaceae bacterium]
MPVIDRALVRRLPKAELHVHLDGSLRPSTLVELAREDSAPLPHWEADALRRHMRVDDARHLEDYLARFHLTLSVMQRADALERIAYELAEDAWHDGVRYLEVRYAPILNVERGLTLHEAVEAPLRGLRRAERDFGIVARVIVCAMRNMAPEVSMQMAELAVHHRDRGVVGFDLAGGEFGHPAAAHAAAFAYARSHDLACTCHAGEGDGAGSIRQAVHLCGAHRIGHGTRLDEDERLLRYVNDRRIPIEICLTSNVQTRVVASYAEHPLRRYYDAGLPVVLNTDNRLMSGVTLTDEFMLAAEHLGFTLDELGELALMGFEHAFLPWAERQQLLARMEAEVDALLRTAE